MNFISTKRVEEENLVEVRIEFTDSKGMRHVDWKVPDTDGVFYDAILNEDGTIHHQTGRYSGPDAFERFRAPSDLIAATSIAFEKYRRELDIDPAVDEVKSIAVEIDSVIVEETSDVAGPQ